MIEAKGLSKTFKNVKAVDMVDAQFKEGKFYGIMGQSGSGKTTLLSLLGLLDKPSAGDVIIDGISSCGMTPTQKANRRMDALGFVFQDFYLNPVLKAYENVMLPMFIHPKHKNTDIKGKSLLLLERFGLAHRSEHQAKTLSGGEKQRVALARALANNPKYILADEPTGNLDEPSGHKVLDALKALSLDGHGVIVVTHNPLIQHYADVLLTMEAGVLKVVNP